MRYNSYLMDLPEDCLTRYPDAEATPNNKLVRVQKSSRVDFVNEEGKSEFDRTAAR